MLGAQAIQPQCTGQQRGHRQGEHDRPRHLKRQELGDVGQRHAVLNDDLDHGEKDMAGDEHHEGEQGHAKRAEQFPGYISVKQLGHWAPQPAS